MPSPDTIAAIAAIVFMALLVLSMRLVRPPGSSRPRHGAAWLDAHEVPATARYGPYDDEPARAEAVADTSPWAVPAVLATIPDALTIARTV